MVPRRPSYSFRFLVEVPMYALAIIRYRRPLEEVLPHVEEHRAYLRGLYDNGWLLASRPFQPRAGGAFSCGFRTVIWRPRSTGSGIRIPWYSTGWRSTNFCHGHR